MKISVQPYQKAWQSQFLQIKQELNAILQELNPIIEHIGSTSVEHLSAKPIIDINVGVKREQDFEKVVTLMATQSDYLYYKVFNESLPQRRLFVKLNDAAEKWAFPNVFSNLNEIPHEETNEKRIAHVHVWVFGSPDWIRHIAFRDYLRENEVIRKEYENLKLGLAKKEWADGMEYNAAKNDFIKKIEAEAINWYFQKNV
jgi:GrpB-like predicted nucleotidyltransferase (UPF0157 family)